jgi:hypothetical protein
VYALVDEILDLIHKSGKLTRESFHLIHKSGKLTRESFYLIHKSGKLALAAGELMSGSWNLIPQKININFILLIQILHQSHSPPGNLFPG